MTERLLTDRELAALLRRLAQLEQRVGRVEVIERPTYAKGVYTPTYVGGTTAGVTTYSFQDAAYTRVGNLVTARGQINWTAATGTGDARVSLPFTAAAANFSGALWLIGVTFAAGTPLMRLASGTNYFTMISPATNAAGTVVQVEAAGTIIWTVTYMIP